MPILGPEQPAHGWNHAEGGEIVVAHQLAGNPLGRRRAELYVPSPHTAGGQDICERLRGVAHLAIGRIGEHRARAAGAQAVDLDQALGVAHGHRAQDEGVGQAEQRAVDANAEGERGQDDECEDRAAAIQAAREDQIGAHFCEEPQSALVPAVLLGLLETAKSAAGAAARRVLAEAGRDQVGGVPFEVIAELGVEPLLDLSLSSRSLPDLHDPAPWLRSPSHLGLRHIHP